MIRPFILAAACVGALVCQGSDDEAHFKPKSYTPSQTLRDRSYSESVYKPSVASQSIGKRIEAPAAASRWRLFGRAKALEDTQKLADKPVEHETAYRQEKQISVPTIKADPSDAPDRKPFEDASKKLTDGTFKAKDEPREKNPLLTPRQGIKAPE